MSCLMIEKIKNQMFSSPLLVFNIEKSVLLEEELVCPFSDREIEAYVYTNIPVSLCLENH